MTTTASSVLAKSSAHADGNNNNSNNNEDDATTTTTTTKRVKGADDNPTGGYSSDPELIRSISFVATDTESFPAGTFSQTSDEDEDRGKAGLESRDRSADELLSTYESTSKLVVNPSTSLRRTHGAALAQNVAYRQRKMREVPEADSGDGDGVLDLSAKRRLFSTRSFAVPSHRKRYSHHRAALNTIRDIGGPETDGHNLRTVSSSTLFPASGVAAAASTGDSVATDARTITGLRVSSNPCRTFSCSPTIPFKRGLELTARGIPNGLVLFSSLKNRKLVADSMLMSRRRRSEEDGELTEESGLIDRSID